MARLDPVDDEGVAEGFSRQPLFATEAERPVPAPMVRPQPVPHEANDQAAPVSITAAVASATGVQHQPTGRPAPAGLDPALNEMVRAIDKALANSNQSIIDALKGAAAVPAQPARRRWAPLFAAVGLASAAFGAVLAGGAAYALLGTRAPAAVAVGSNSQAYADSWTYLWQASPAFRECWTNHIRTRQPQSCAVTIGIPAPAGRAQ